MKKEASHGAHGLHRNLISWFASLHFTLLSRSISNFSPKTDSEPLKVISDNEKISNTSAPNIHEDLCFWLDRRTPRPQQLLADHMTIMPRSQQLGDRNGADRGRCEAWPDPVRSGPTSEHIHMSAPISWSNRQQLIHTTCLQHSRNMFIREEKEVLSCTHFCP